MEERDISAERAREKKEAKKNFWKDRPLFAVGLMIFVVFCACILVFFTLFRYNGFATGWSKLIRILQPIIFGAIIAYLINPVMMFLERHIIHYFEPKVKDQEKLKKTARTVGILGALVFLVMIVVALVGLIIPQLVQSIMGLVDTVPKQVQYFTEWLDTHAEDSETIETFSNMLLSATNYLENWLEETVLPQAATYISSITSGVYNLLKGLLNMIIGLIVSTYILMSKEKFVGEFKKMIYAIFRPDAGNKIVITIRKSNEIFGGFIVGKLIDSLIIGIIAFIVLSIMRMPYSMLVAVIVGVTNIIPFFGPFIGAIPSFLLIVLADPLKGLYFLIFVFILQQVDGNIIGPKILGNSTGLSSFWVIFAILIGGGFFGVPGMILGVPTFAVIYFLFKKWIEYMLRKKKLPENSEDYITAEKVNPENHTLVYPEPDTEVVQDNTEGFDKKKDWKTTVFNHKNKEQ